MSTALRRLPGFAIAIVALALSASLVFAGQPVGNVGGLGTAASHAGKTVPVVTTSDNEGADEDTDTETDEDATETGEDTDTETDTTESDSADNCTVDLTQDPSVLVTLNHGSVVCSAAHATTWDPALYKNKGAWVSSWAKMNHGHDPNKQHGNSANH